MLRWRYPNCSQAIWPARPGEAPPVGSVTRCVEVSANKLTTEERAQGSRALSLLAGLKVHAVCYSGSGCQSREPQLGGPIRGFSVLRSQEPSMRDPEQNPHTWCPALR